jgi:hypothetical protein
MMIHSNNQIPFGPVFQGLAADPQAKHYRLMKQAVWLYLYLIGFSNIKTGKLTARLSDIAKDMGIREETLRSWLGHLRKGNYIAVEKQGDQLLFKITKWKNISSKLEIDKWLQTNIQKSKGRRSANDDDPKPEQKVSNTSKLARQIAKDLDSHEGLAYFEKLCSNYPQKIILQSLKEAKAIPAEKIKKSRSALFVYLVKKYAK